MKKKLTIIALVLLFVALVGAAACTPDEGVFSEGLVAVRDEYGYWGYVNSSGKSVIANNYASVTPFENGVAVVYTIPEYEENPRCFLIDTKGDIVAGPFENAALSEGGRYAYVCNADTGLYGVYDVDARAYEKECVYSAIGYEEGKYCVFGYVAQDKPYLEFYDLKGGTFRHTLTLPYEGDMLLLKGYACVSSPAPSNGDGSKPLNDTIFSVYSAISGEKEDFAGAAVDYISENAPLIALESYVSSGGEDVLTYTVLAGQKQILSAPKEDVTVLTDKEERDILLAVSDEEGGMTYYALSSDGVMWSGSEKPELMGGSYYVREGEEYVFFIGGRMMRVNLPHGQAESISASTAYGVLDNVTGEIYLKITASAERTETNEFGEEISTWDTFRYLVSPSGEIYDITSMDSADSPYSLSSVHEGKLVLQNTDNNRFALYNLDGSAVTDFIYSDIEGAGSGYYEVVLGRAHGIIDSEGKEVLAPAFADIVTRML